MKDPLAAEGIRFIDRVASDPSLAIRGWKALSGRAAVGCPPRFPVPEILHCAGLLPVRTRCEGELRSMGSLIDAWVLDPPEPFPQGLAGALDWVEAIAEWAEILSGTRCTEGALWKSLRAFRERDALLRDLSDRCGKGPGYLEPGTFRNVIASGNYLPVETHAILLERILGCGIPPKSPSETTGDPFLHLARRVRTAMDGPHRPE